MLLSHPNQYQPNDFNDNKQVILTINIISEISGHQLGKARIVGVYHNFFEYFHFNC